MERNVYLGLRPELDLEDEDRELLLVLADGLLDLVGALYEGDFRELVLGALLVNTSEELRELLVKTLSELLCLGAAFFRSLAFAAGSLGVALLLLLIFGAVRPAAP